MREHVKGNRGDSAQEKTIHQMIEFKWEVILDVGKAAHKKKLNDAKSSPSKRDTENLVANLSTIPVVNALEGSIRGGDTEKGGVFNAMIYLYSKAPRYSLRFLGHLWGTNREINEHRIKQ